MGTTAVLVPLLSIFVVLAAAIASLVYRQPRGRHHLQMRTRVRVYLGRRHR